MKIKEREFKLQRREESRRNQRLKRLLFNFSALLNNLITFCLCNTTRFLTISVKVQTCCATGLKRTFWSFVDTVYFLYSLRQGIPFCCPVWSRVVVGHRWWLTVRGCSTYLHCSHFQTKQIYFVSFLRTMIKFCKMTAVINRLQNTEHNALSNCFL